MPSRIPRWVLALLAWPVVAAGAAKPPPALDRPAGLSIDLRGHVRTCVDAVTEHWLLRAPADNPAMLGMFRDRDRPPHRDLLPWSGEFAGKYLTAGTQVLRLTGDARLRTHLRAFVDELVTLQAEDGYLGPFPKGSRLTGKAPNCRDGTWDAWGHYHAMLGLILWHELTNDDKALRCARRIGDLLCATFLGPDRRLVDTGSAEMNQAVVHSLAILGRVTGEKRYLDLAREVVDEFALPGAGDYLRVALAGKAFHRCPKPRWESLHPILGLIELHRATGDDDHRKAFEHLWWSIVEHDRHNNGGFSSGEQATGDPYHRGAIETCCTIAWMAMSVEMLRTTGDSVVADELELSTLNQVIGLHSPTGKWCTYDTPMDGVRRPSTVDIAFQKRPGSEGLNCCSVNAARGFGMIGEWALMADAGGGSALAVNWYGPSTMSARIGGAAVKIEQATEYPRQGRVTLKVTPEQPTRFALKLRVPHWSRRTAVSVNGVPVRADDAPRPGRYCVIEREWRAQDVVALDLDLSPHAWLGERSAAGRASIYRGPILLAFEPGDARGIRPEPKEPWKAFGDLWACDKVGATLETTFEGEGVKWFGRRFDDAGRARVEIDGQVVATVDQYGPQREAPFAWEHRDPALGRGRHTLRLTILGEKDGRSKGTWVNVVGFGAPGSDDPHGRPPQALRPAGIASMKLEDRLASAPPRPWIVVHIPAADGRAAVRLVDYASAGEGGARYVTWLPVEGVTATAYSRATPLRSKPVE